MKRYNAYNKSNYDFDERDLHKVTFAEFSDYSRLKKREYFCHMRDCYGYSVEDFAKELNVNVSTVKVWFERVGFHPVSSFDNNRKKKSKENLILQRTISVFGPSMPARKLCYE